MPWLKGQSSHAHGLGSPQYQEIPAGADIESMKAEFEFDFPDRDGFRQPVFEILERLPADVREQKIASATQSIGYYRALLGRLIQERE